jgi:Ni/Co efflux regulator RcnB
MKRTLTAAAVALTALTAGGGALAQPYDHHDNGRYDNGRHDNGRHMGFVRHDDWRRGHRMDRADWDRGQRLDWRRHHLRRPPRGYEWREVDGNYVLAAAATGLIASIIANSR